MIDCASYRRSVLADPRDEDPRLREHRESCSDCREYTLRLLRFEGRLEHALRVAAAPAAAATALPLRRPGALDSVHRRRRRGWLAMAASVLIALIVAGGLWLGASGPSLAADVVAHMAEEPEAWARTDVPVPAPDLDRVLQNTRMRLKPDAVMVSYAASCLFRGYRVPHMVVQTSMGPVTVMVLVHESVSQAVPFDEEGYRGVIVPVPGHGSLAVLVHGGQGDLRAVREIAARVQDAIVWTS
jgi:uncharacterized protein DUF3379